MIVSCWFGADTAPDNRLPVSAMLLLITGIPKLLRLEEGVGVDIGHAELMSACERYLDDAEPPARRRKTPKAARPKR